MVVFKKSDFFTCFVASLALIKFISRCEAFGNRIKLTVFDVDTPQVKSPRLMPYSTDDVKRLPNLFSTMLGSSSSSSDRYAKQRDIVENNFGNSDESRKPTLYDMLQISPSATRDEIKEAYIKLAKITHPDAARNSISSQNGTYIIQEANQISTTHTFAEISAGYKQLMDPLTRKRYDRELVAEAFKRDVERAAAEMGSVAGPQIKKILDRVAIPIFRRTTATTSAVLGEVIKDLQTTQHRRSQGKDIRPDFNATSALLEEAFSIYDNQKTPPESTYDFDLKRLLSTAVEAGKNAGRAIDRLEQAEKSRDLEKRAKLETLRANNLKRKAYLVENKRLHATLQTSNSGITSKDAIKIVEILNSTSSSSTSRTLMENLFQKRTIEEQVLKLAELEGLFLEKKRDWHEAEVGYERSKTQVEKFQNMLRSAEKSVERARTALNKAEEQVERSKYLIADAKQNVTASEYFRKSSQSEFDKVLLEMTRQQERVRTQLKKKQDALESNGIRLLGREERILMGQDLNMIVKSSGKAPTNKAMNVTGSDYDDDEVDFDETDMSGADLLDKLLRIEMDLSLESQRREETAKRLRSRAAKLRNQAGDPLEDALA